jgi:uncharacterized protein (TIGR00725 family)
MRTRIGVMGSSAAEQPGSAIEFRVAALAARLGQAIADRQCVLVTGATSGLPHLVSIAAQDAGALTVGISPANDEKEHREHYRLPLDGLDVMVYTGFGLKGRNVVNIHSSDVVIVLGGSTGTLNEFTIALDEGKVIGILEGTGGVSDHIRDIIRFCDREEGSRILFNENPESLVDICLAEFKRHCR